MIELENWCAYFSKKVFAPSPTNFLPQSFGKTSVFDKAQSNEKDKDKGKDKDKDKGKWCYCIARAFRDFTPLPRLEKYRYDSL